jgi:hypothetical protein
LTYADGTVYGHIIDPSTGAPAETDLKSVTVICSSGITADLLSTALFVMGKKDALDYWREYGDFQMILVTDSGQVLCTSGLTEAFTLQSQATPCLTPNDRAGILPAGRSGGSPGACGRGAGAHSAGRERKAPDDNRDRGLRRRERHRLPRLHKGRTKRSEMLYHDGGTIFVYLCYGMYWMLNIVTGAENDPRAC